MSSVGYDALMSKGRWGVFTNGRAVWLCDETLSTDEHWCSGAFAHTLPSIHRGPMRRVRPLWAPWQSPSWCVRWAIGQLDDLNAVPSVAKQIAQQIADAAEVERIMEAL